jgi:YD repeat-containing protein
VKYTRYAYDALSRLWKVADAEGNVIRSAPTENQFV